MNILTVKYPCTITIIVVAGSGVYCKVFGIWNKILISDLFWKLIFVLLGWVPTRSSSCWSLVFIDMDLLATLVKSHIWLDRWPSSRATNISTSVDLEVNLLQILVVLLINGHNVCLCKWMLVFRFILPGSWFPPIWICNIVVFTRSLLYKGLIVDENLCWYGIHVTHTRFLDKLRNALVLLNFPKTESRVRSILKYRSDLP